MALPRVWRRGRRHRELAAELDLHLAHEIEEGLEAGLSRQEASRRAHVKIGNTTRIHEDVRGP